MKKSVVAAMTAFLMLFAVAGCTPINKGQTPGSQDNDPYDPDFTKLPAPPAGLPSGTATWSVRVQAYKADGTSRGGRVTVHINAVAADPRAQGGVSGSRNGPFPFDDIKSMPYQFPFYIQPGIVVSVTSTFTSLITKGEKLACWLTNSYGQEIPHTREEKSTTTDSPSNVQPQTVNCAGNIG